jgi:hypothetical protein
MAFWSNYRPGSRASSSQVLEKKSPNDDHHQSAQRELKLIRRLGSGQDQEAAAS